MTDIKVCTKCRALKRLDEFGRDHTRKTGYRADCRACRAAYQRGWAALNREHVRTYYRDWYHRRIVAESKAKEGQPE